MDDPTSHDHRTGAVSAHQSPGRGVGEVADFELLMELGHGSVGRVFLARQRSMQRLVAVKMMDDVRTDSPAPAQLDHDNIVRVFDRRVLDGGRTTLLYMQYVPGGTLLTVLQRLRQTPRDRWGGRLLLDVIDEVLEAKGEIRPIDSSTRAYLSTLAWPDLVAWLGRRLAEALDHAGRRGVLHGNLTPSKVLLTAEGVPKLTDFRSTAWDAGGPGGGAVAYWAPEQVASWRSDTPISNSSVGHRSDIFGLGVLLWELLTGMRPFAGEIDDDASGAAAKVRGSGAQATAPAAVPPQCPASLQRVLLTCLAPDPKDRWPSGAELARQLQMCLDPRARDLVDPSPRSWRWRLRPWELPILVLAVLIPNALAGLYNYNHNKTLIISVLPIAEQQHFERIQLVINLFAFPVGTVVLLYLCRYCMSVPRGLRKGRRYDSSTLARARTDTLLLGDRIVLVVFGLWLLAGIAYPLALRDAAGQFPPDGYVHFIGSLVVCGAIAVAYPFFLVTFYAVRCIYPMMLPQALASARDAGNLRGLDRRSTLYLATAASVPLVAVAAVTFLPSAEITGVLVAVRVLSVGAIAAFAVVYWLRRLLEQDLRALERIVSYQLPAAGSRGAGGSTTTH